jgi:hypothetical protein
MNVERCGTCYRRLRDGRCPVHGPEDDGPPPPEPSRQPGGTLDLFAEPEPRTVGRVTRFGMPRGATRLLPLPFLVTMRGERQWAPVRRAA